MYYCIDENLEQVIGSGGSENAHYLYTVRVSGSYVPGDGYALSCVVCTKWLLTGTITLYDYSCSVKDNA